MLQRIQTVFLFIVVILMALFLVFPVWATQAGSEGSIYRLYALFLFNGPSENPQAGAWNFWPYISLGIFAIISIIVALIEVFSYSKRLKQIKLGALNSLILGLLLIGVIWFVSGEQEIWISENPGNYSVGIFFPPLAILCNIFANFFIRRDEKLVRSMDRLR